MTDKHPEALRLADALDLGHPLAEEAQQAAALLRAQHKQIAAYKLLTESQEAQLSRHRAQADKFREAIATLQSEREANAILTAAIERKDALLRQALEALNDGVDYVREDYRTNWRHGVPSRQAQLDDLKAQVDEHEAAIEAINSELSQ